MAALRWWPFAARWAGAAIPAVARCLRQRALWLGGQLLRLCAGEGGRVCEGEAEGPPAVCEPSHPLPITLAQVSRSGLIYNQSLWVGATGLTYLPLPQKVARPFAPISAIITGAAYAPNVAVYTNVYLARHALVTAYSVSGWGLRCVGTLCNTHVRG